MSVVYLRLYLPISYHEPHACCGGRSPLGGLAFGAMMSPVRWSQRFILCTVSECRFDGAVQHWQARDSYVYAAVSVEVQPRHQYTQAADLASSCFMVHFPGVGPVCGPEAAP